jgi:Domain of unknown function (DUF6933)
MAILRCTQKLLSELKLRPSDSIQQPDELSSWHANLLRIGRRKCVLFTHDTTLYSFFIPGLKKPDFENIREVFRQNFFKSLIVEDIPQKHIEIFLEANREIRISKTNNRSVLGSMNDLAFQLKDKIAYEGGIENTDITKLIHDINRIPMSAIEEIYSIYELKKLFEKLNK